MTAAAARTFTFAVGYRYVCELTLPTSIKPGGVVHVSCEWTPRVPKRLSAKEWSDYVAGRDRAYAAVLIQGQRAAVLDLDAQSATLTVIESSAEDDK